METARLEHLEELTEALAAECGSEERALDLVELCLYAVLGGAAPDEIRELLAVYVGPRAP